MTDVTLSPTTPVTNGAIVTASNPLPVTVVGAPTLTSLTITNGTVAGTTTFTYPTSAIGEANEMITQATRANLNVSGDQNLDRAGFSARIFRASSPTGLGREKSAIGVANDQTTSLQNSVYWEGWSGYSTPSNNTTSTASTIAATVLTVGGTVGGVWSPGQLIYGAGVTAGTKIITYGTGTGGAGTYNLDTSMTVASPVVINALGYAPDMRIEAVGWNDLIAGATSTASSIATTVLTVGGSITGTWRVGQLLTGVGVTANTRIISLGTGTGGAGTYNLSVSQTVTPAQTINSLGSDTREDHILMTAEGYIKVGGWGVHSSYPWIWDPSGNVAATGNIVMSQGGLTVQVGNTSVQTLAVAGNINMQNGIVPNWVGGPAFRRTADGVLRITTAANTAGANLDFTAADTLKLANLANNAAATFQFGVFTATGGETYAGYITVKDYAGNTRKLAVFA